MSAYKMALIIVKATYANPYTQFSYKNVDIIPNEGWIGIIIGSSVGYFLLLLVLVIIMTRRLTLRKLREMQSPNIVYFLKKKII